MKLDSYKNIFVLCLLFFFGSMSAFAQNVLGQKSVDLITTNNPNASARLQGLGGAGVSLGGDLGASLINPAGLGFYRSSELVISPQLNFYNTKSSYLGNNSESRDSKFGIGSFGLVIRIDGDPHRKSNWHGGSIGLSYSTSNNYDSKIRYGGRNTQHDILDSYIEEANSIGDLDNNSGRYAGFAYDSYLIDKFEDADKPDDAFYDRLIETPPTENFPTSQAKIIETSGYNRSWNVSYGANYKDEWFFGAGINLQTINYKEKVSYQEVYPDSDLLNHGLEEEVRVDGSGINVSVGAIYKPTDALNIGFSYTSPTWYSLDFEEDFIMTANFNNYQYNDTTLLKEVGTSGLWDSRRVINSPSKLNLGATFFLQKQGFLTANIEYLNYSNVKVTSNDGSTSDINTSINTNFSSVLNIKLGAEYRLERFRFRGGYALYPSPMQAQENGLKLKEDLQQVSFGVGLRERMWFLDLSVVNSWEKSKDIAYEVDDYGGSSIADISQNRMNMMLTLGFKL